MSLDLLMTYATRQVVNAHAIPTELDGNVMIATSILTSAVHLTAFLVSVMKSVAATCSVNILLEIALALSM